MPFRRIRVFLSLFLLLSSALGFAQTTGGSLTGTVHDASGASISGAWVVATETATNAHTRSISNARGEYELINLKPGMYTLKIEASGFQSYEQTGIHLDLNQHGTQDVTLNIGQVQQNVEVRADVSELDTTSSASTSEVNGAAIANLPLNTRESYALLELIPGYSGSIGNDYNAVSYSINGGDNEYGDILVDGTPAGFPTVNGYQGVGIFPSVDAIGEFRMLAQDYQAEFGRTLDGVLNVVYKSGTNQFHGTAFEFIRNNALDANDYFSNQEGSPLPAFHRNQYGGTLGGPIYKDKTFFFISTELLFQNSFQSLTATVPTDLERAGDFSQTYASDGTLIKIYNPFSTRENSSGSGYIRDQFVGDDGTVNKIPSKYLSTVAQNAVKYYPEPNVTGNSVTHANNYYKSGSTVKETLAWDLRLDHMLSPQQKVFGRYSNRYYGSNPNPLFPSADAVAEGLIDAQDFSRGVTLGYTATPSANKIVDLRLGFARTLYEYYNTSLGFKASTLGLPSSINQYGGVDIFPYFAPSGFESLGNEGNRHNAFMTYSLLGSYTWVYGEHTFKFGFDSRMIRVNDHESNDSSGAFSFSTDWTQGPDPDTSSSYAGNGLASMLVGMGSGDMIQNYKNVATQSFYYAGYAQDDWRITPKLTLNLGVRYDIDLPRTERYNRMNYFDPKVASPYATEISGLTGGLVFAGVDGRSRYQYHIDANNVAPRVGFSWAVHPTTVVHGGAAIVYGASNQAAAGTVGPYGFRVQNTWDSSVDGITPLNTLDNPFPNGFSAAPGASGGLATGAGGQIEGVYQNSPTPYMYQWGLDVQQSLPGQITFDIAYVGNRGRQLLQSYEGGLDFDQLPTADLALGSALNDTVSNPFYGVLATNTTLGATSTISRAQLLLKFPQYTSMEPLRYSGGNSQYDGLQVSFSKRIAHGLQVQGNYVWSRNYDNNSDHQDSFRPMADYAISYQDIRQRFVASYIYQLPFGRGQIFGGNISRWEDALMGGWQLNGITTLQGGNPLQINANNDLSSFNFQNLYADTNGQNATLHGRVASRLNNYFNTNDFSQPSSFSLGNGPAYYDNLRAPGYTDTDLSVFKEFHPTEKVKVDFRAEAFNILNHANFSSPDTTVTDTDFGAITSTAADPRQLQFALKLLF
ncbi:carboxypeptidase regulatory-like domain-containing protein [Telmatobacter bradus]|uniref:carboxypeptidase regulatory-like domain-containing protein n=1 Tax=Telmatobacter bradus TaxID=474953 RepID=UPI003B43241A